MNYCIDVQSKAESKDSKNVFSDEEINTPSSFNQNLSQKQVELQEIKKKKVPYRWQPEQHKQYIRFLIQRRELFDMTLQRKIVMGIHNLMSQYLKNRTSLQCRSHHQKMLVKYKTIDNIISANTHLFQSNNKEQMPQNCENSVIDLFEPKIEGAISFFQDFLSFQAFPERTRGLSGHDGMVEIESYQYNQNFSFELD